MTYPFSRDTILKIETRARELITTHFARQGIHNVHVNLTHISSDIAHVYDARVTFLDELNFDQIANIAKLMEMYCGNDYEEDMSFIVDGREYLIGDGDDMGACTMYGSTLRVWVRHFPE